jgi:hypothetical protein
MADVLLIHPPVSLPSEPPLGLGLLSALLRSCGLRVNVIDANVEALSQVIHSVPEDAGTTTSQRRALHGRARALEHLRGPLGYTHIDRYRRALSDLDQILLLAGSAFPSTRMALAAYHEDHASPLSSDDLHAAAAHPERSPFAPCFRLLALRAAAEPPRLIGLSVNYLHQALPAMALAGTLRAALPHTPLLLGGALFRCWKQHLAPSSFAPHVDEILFGDELSPLFLRLGLSPKIPERLPWAPDYSRMPWSLYLAPERIAPICTSRGCAWGRCRYCPEALSGEIFSPLPADQVPVLLDDSRRSAEAELIHIADSAIPEPTLDVLSRQRWNARWYGFSRFSPRLARADFCRDLQRSGCEMIQLGLESGSETMLQRLRKGIRLDQASRALRELADAGIAVYLYVMFGIPSETRSDAMKTLEFVVDHAPCITFMNISLLNLPLQSPEESDLRLIPFSGNRNDLALYSGFECTDGWQRREARRFMERDFARHPTIATILRRTPPVFGANHAPFFPHRRDEPSR